MTNLITIETTRGKVTLLYGVRTLSIASKLKGIEGIGAFMQAMTNPSFEDVAILLFAGHENACFEQKKDLVFTDIDDCFKLIEEIGLADAVKYVNEGIHQIVGTLTGSKKKVEKT